MSAQDSDTQPAFYQKVQNCLCGRAFSHSNAFSNHRRTCKLSKKRLSGAIAKAKEVWAERKRRRIGAHSVSLAGDAGLSELKPVSDSEGVTPRPEQLENLSTSDPGDVEMVVEDLRLPLAQRRPRRENRRLPLRFRDVIPQPSAALPPTGADGLQPQFNLLPDDIVAGTASQPGTHALLHRFRRTLKSPRNAFGLFRQYHAEEFPSHDPEEHITLDDLSDVSGGVTHPQLEHGNRPSFGPYPNHSSFRLGDWYWNQGVQKSQASFREMVDIIADPEFHPADVRDTRWNSINQQLGSSENEEGWMEVDAGWEQTPVTISVPFHRFTMDPGPRDYVVADFYHRNLVTVIREKLSNYGDSQLFHFEPYELFWQPGDAPEPTRIQGELYTSPAFIDAHNQLQNSPAEPGCDLQKVVVAMMFSSDTTHLTSFGTAKLWPLYLYFGNESKYRRCKPSSNLCNHVAYFQKLPDAFKDFAAAHTGKNGPSEAFMTHCHRELLHAQWKVLLDDEFLEAYEHGIVIICWDGIGRRFYPRIFIYSADYPEKILLASIRNLGACPCPRCLIPLFRARNFGMSRDMTQRTTLARVDDRHRQSRVTAARNAIYGSNYAVDSVPVDRLLKEESLVPTSNAFSERLAPLGFNMFQMFVVDLMHEVEIGTWRSLFIHLLRILESAHGGLIHELDRRYREMPTFGKDTIRRFSSNCSQLKKLAARDYEDLLQCAIPVFDGLLPEPHNRRLLQLLFIMGHWHGLAKLRMHTASTLHILDQVTATLGKTLREFQETTCAAYQTRELQREADARKRRQAKQPARTPSSQAGRSRHLSGQSGMQAQPSSKSVAACSGGGQIDGSSGSTKGPRLKTLNLDTYKYHALGDYVSAIRQYGTVDSYSTEMTELEHRRAKGRYRRTSRKHYLRQVTQIERRQARICRIRERLNGTGKPKDEEVASSPGMRYHVGKTQNHVEHIPHFIQKHAGDPAVQRFLPKLKEHLLPRIKTMLEDEASSSVDATLPPSMSGSGLSAATDQNGHNSVLFKNDRMYMHKLIRFNYTTYDVRRSQDVINPRTSHCNVMLLAQPEDEAHRYWYARVLGIYHVNVIYTGPGMIDYRPRRLNFLWVRWYQLKEDEPAGWDAHRLDRLCFPPMAGEAAFGFVDPADVLRSSYITPRYAEGKRHADGVGLSFCAGDSRDWRSYYVDRFVDRDMVMRYHWGLGVGHVYPYTVDHRVPGAGAEDRFPLGSELEPSGLQVEVQTEEPSTIPADLSGSNNPEHSMGDRENEDLGDDSMSGSEDGVDCWSDDEVFIAMDEMYDLE